MTIDAHSTLIDVCFAVCTALQEQRITAVLTGGSAATFYAPEAYQSRDADFVITLDAGRGSGSRALSAIGFIEGNGMYVHAVSAYTLEFRRGPLQIGGTFVTSWDTHRRSGQSLHVLTRTDSIKDRLSAFYAWRDIGSLHAAVAVARSGEFDAHEIRRWSDRENASADFKHFQATLASEMRAPK